MNSNIPLDYAVFQLSPRRSRCELFVSYDGTTEKLASGSVKPFVNHLKAAEEQFASAVKSIKLEVKRCKNSESWFTKGTFERFVQFVSNPEVLELVNTFDAEMSQLEAAKKIYSQGPGEGSGSDGGATTASDATKKELLRAIDLRLTAVGQHLSTACIHASTAGFNPVTVLELQLFADQFGAHSLSESCSKFMSLCQRRPELYNTRKYRVNDQAVRSSSGSDMSLDDQANDLQIGSLLNQHQTSQPDELKSTPLQPENKPSEDVKGSSDMNKDKKEDTFLAVADSESPSTEVGRPARRLSVQDRISLFENKQKENSSGSGSKAVVGKSTELRRLSSDVSSAGQMASEKAVLRRWSGASDMSIDSSGERRDVDSSVVTPTAPIKTSTPVVSEDMDKSDLHNSGTLLMPEINGIHAIQGGHIRLENQSNSKEDELETEPYRTKLGAQPMILSGASQEASQVNSRSFSRRSENDRLKDQSNVSKQSNASFGRTAEDTGFRNQITSQALPRKIEQFASRAPTSCVEKNIMCSSPEECRTVKQECIAQKAQLGVSLGRTGYDLSNCETYHEKGELEDTQSRDRHVSVSQLSTFQRAVTDLVSDSESSVVSSVSAVSQRRGNEVDQVIAPPKPRSLGQRNEVVNKEYKPAEQQPENSSIELEDSNAHRINFQRHGSAAAQAKKSKGRRDDSGLVMPGFAGKSIGDNEEIFSSIISSTSLEQAQRVKQSKGNQELHDELKLKADELEKLFAAHKLRLPANQSSVTRRSKSVEAQEQIANLVSRDSSVEFSTPQSASTKVVHKPSHSGNIEKFTTSPLIQPLETQEFDKTPKQNLYGFGSSDDSRGKLYDKYMQKRHAKLKEEWSSNKAEKEARMKALEDSFERNRSEMKFKFAGSADRQDSPHRAEKLRSFSARSAIRREQPIHSFVSDEDEDQAEFGQGGSSRRSVQNKKAFSNISTVSSTPRTSGAPAPRSSAKASGSSTGRRKLQPENPLAQSVPNFSDLRKENTKPSTASSKGAGRSQVRTYTRSKSSNDDVLSFEEKLRRPHHMRKSSANPLEVKDLTSLNFEDVEHEDELSRRSEAGSLLRKGNTSSIPRSRASAKTLVNEDEELMNTNKEEEDLELVDEAYGNMDNGNPIGSQESVKSTNSGCENGDAMRVPSEVNPASMSEMPAVLPSAFRSMVSVLDSPGESPGSWHSRMHNPYSFQHEISDFDASVDSPIGSPAYWNTNDSDTARMRKKWGAAQKPIIDSSHGQSRKETKGLKRFLNFGRKNRGPDSLIDWVSATTSEGDDDTEDGKDLAKWSSEDLRKSRMGFSQYQLDDGFSETDSGGEKARGFPSSIPTPPMNFKLKEDQFSGSALKAPKSFFSLSTFRSKGSDSKPR